jgi:thiamine biosynthesis protein ThiS
MAPDDIDDRRADQSAITITLNGKPRSIPARMSLSGLIDDLEVDRRTIAVARNEDVIPRDGYKDVLLEAGDRIEIVRMVGGG